MIAVRLTPVLAEPADGAEQVTQVLPGEQAEIVERSGEWARVVVPSQPSSQDERGYPGWVHADALAPCDAESEQERTSGITRSPEGLVREARRYLGTRYVWGGMTSDGIDCSGLTHMAARALGVTIPRDARDQIRTLAAVDLAEVDAGDLYFFAKPDGRITHVAIALGPVEEDGGRAMIHASDAPEQHLVLEERMSAGRRASLVAAARLPSR